MPGKLFVAILVCVAALAALGAGLAAAAIPRFSAKLVGNSANGTV
jgi:hypothetical protein